MIDALPQIFNFLLSVLTALADLYMDNPVLSAFFSLWILDRIFGIFDRLTGR